MSQIQQQPEATDEEARFVTHLGVWWRLYPESEYIEDFPYCPCCEPRKKLIQIEWYPDEIFKCPITATEIKLYDTVPRKLHDVLAGLHRSYFGDHWFADDLRREFRRLRELSPSKSEAKVLRQVLSLEPFNRIPKEEVGSILERFQNPECYRLRENVEKPAV